MLGLIFLAGLLAGLLLKKLLTVVWKNIITVQVKNIITVRE